MLPDKTKATGRVKRPIASSPPPTSSITPCTHNKVMNAGWPFGGVGNPSSFALPCSKNKSAMMMRTRLSVSGKYFLNQSGSIRGLLKFGLSPKMQKRLLLFQPLVFSCDPLGVREWGEWAERLAIRWTVPTNKSDGEPPAGRDRQPLLRWMS